MEAEHMGNIEEKDIQEILLANGFISEISGEETEETEETEENKENKIEPKISLDGLLLLCSHFLEESAQNGLISIVAIKEPDIGNNINTNIDKYSLTVLSNNNKFGIPIKTFGLQLRNQNNNLAIEEEEEEEEEENSKEERKKHIYIYISDLICNKIQSIKGNKTLNFIIWSGSEHNSIVFEHENNYYFLDSCGYCYERFPHSTINGLIPGENAFHIESQIQTDNFNCSSFCLEFIKTLYGIYMEQKKSGSNLNKYLQPFFIDCGDRSDCEFSVEVPKGQNKYRRYGLLPPEILIYFQSFKFLENISVKLLFEYIKYQKQIEKQLKCTEQQLKINEQTKEKIECQIKQFKNRNIEPTQELKLKQQLFNYKSIELRHLQGTLQSDLLSIMEEVPKTIKQKIDSVQQSITELLKQLPEEHDIASQKINQARKEHIQLLFSLYKAMQQNKSEQQPVVAKETQQQNTPPKATPTKEVVDGTEKLTAEVNKTNGCRIKEGVKSIKMYGKEEQYTPNTPQ